VNVAAAGCAFAEVDESDISLLLLLQDHGHAASHGASITKMRDDGDNAPIHVANVESIVTAARRAVVPGHPVAENFPERKPANQEGGKIPMAWQDHISFLKLDGRSDADGFLTPASVDTAHDFPLAVENLLYSRLGLASEL
jgi:hypothetical protein